MDEEKTQVQVKSSSKTKMAIAVGFLGLAALAAGFAGIRTNKSSTSLNISKPDLSFVNANREIDGKLNKLSVTLKNSGGVSISSPFVLNIKLGDRISTPLKNIKVENSTFASVKEDVVSLRSEDGSFDIAVKNYRLAPRQTVTITYWFTVPYEYENEKFGVLYTWDTKNEINELDETNNSNYQVFFTNMFLREAKKYWCLNFEKQCVTSSPIDNPQDPNCDSEIYYDTETNCQEAGIDKDYAYVNTEMSESGQGYYTLVTSTEPISGPSRWGKNPVRFDVDAIGNEFGRVSCESSCEVTIMNINGVYGTRWYLDENNFIRNDPNTKLEGFVGNQEDIYFVFHAGDIVKVKLNTRLIGPRASISTPLKLESLSYKYSLGYWNNTYSGYIFEKTGLNEFLPSSFGVYFYYTVVLN